MFGTVEVMLLLVCLVFVRSVTGMTAYVCLSVAIWYNNSPIDFGVGLLDSNDHAIALAAQKIANNTTGDVVDTSHSRSKCTELILAVRPITVSVGRTIVLRRPKILYKLYANDSINGILSINTQYWALDLPISTWRCDALWG